MTAMGVGLSKSDNKSLTWKVKVPKPKHVIPKRSEESHKINPTVL